LRSIRYKIESTAECISILCSHNVDRFECSQPIPNAISDPAEILKSAKCGCGAKNAIADYARNLNEFITIKMKVKCHSAAIKSAFLLAAFTRHLLGAVPPMILK
jgi:hypothetical protein